MPQGKPKDPLLNELRKKRIGDAQRGIKKSPEAVAKMKANLPNRYGENNSNYKGVRKDAICDTCKKVFLGKYGGKNRFCTRQCKWDYQRTLKGELAYNYKHGEYVGNSDRRNAAGYIQWRRNVIARDKYKCVLCGSKKELHCDHIKPFKDYPELRHSLDNGRTLCKWCHYEITFGKSPLNNWKTYSRWAMATRGKQTHVVQPQRLSEGTGRDT